MLCRESFKRHRFARFVSDLIRKAPHSLKKKNSVADLNFVESYMVCCKYHCLTIAALICQINVEEANPRWGKNSKLVLVSLLLAGLLLAALLVAGYYFKTHRKNSKGVRLVSRSEV